MFRVSGLRGVTARMENQMEENREDEMDIGFSGR